MITGFAWGFPAPCRLFIFSHRLLSTDLREGQRGLQSVSALLSPTLAYEAERSREPLPDRQGSGIGQVAGGTIQHGRRSRLIPSCVVSKVCFIKQGSRGLLQRYVVLVAHMLASAPVCTEQLLATGAAIARDRHVLRSSSLRHFFSRMRRYRASAPIQTKRFPSTSRSQTMVSGSTLISIMRLLRRGGSQPPRLHVLPICRPHRFRRRSRHASPEGGTLPSQQL